MRDRNIDERFRENVAAIVTQEKILRLRPTLNQAIPLLKKSSFHIPILLLIALAIRAYGINAWLPAALLDSDERLYVLGGMEILEGMVPRNIEDGTLYVFLLSAVYFLHFLLTNFASILYSLASHDLGRLIGMMNDYFISFYRDPSMQYILARGISVIFGTLAVWAIYLAGKSLYNPTVGLISAVWLLFSPIHVLFSHLGSSYVMGGVLYLLALKAIYETAQEGQLSNYIGAGVLIGMSLATRINTVPLLFGFAVAHILQTNRLKGSMRQYLCDRRVLAGFSAAAFAFYVTCPYVLTNSFLFLKEVGIRVLFPGVSIDIFTALTKIAFTVWSGVGLGVAIFAVIATFSGLYDRRDEAGLILITVLLVDLFFLARSGLPYDRYILFMMFPAILLAAVLVDNVVVHGPLPMGQVVGSALAVLLVFPTAVSSIQYDLSLAKQHTAVQAKDWIEVNLRSGVSILMPKDLIQLPESQKSLQQKLEAISRPDAYRLKYAIQTQPDKPLFGKFGNSTDTYYDIFSDVIMIEEKYWARELSFKLADRTPHGKLFALEPFEGGEFFLIMSRENAISQYKAGHFDYFIDTESHQDLGRPIAVFQADERTTGTSIFIYSGSLHH